MGILIDDGVRELITRPGEGHVLGSGATVPADGEKGWAHGAWFLKTTGTTGADSTYQNIGTTSSANFDVVNSSLIVDWSTLTATIAELNRAADVSARIVDATSASLAVSADSHDGKVIVLNRAAGMVITLPTITSSNYGAKFRFVVKTTFTGTASIESATAADVMLGHALMGNDTNNTVVDWPATIGDGYNKIDLFGTANSTGGMAGQSIEITILGANLFYVEIRGDAAGTEATPFVAT